MSAMPDDVVNEVAIMRDEIAEVRAFLREVEAIYPIAYEAQWEQSPASRSPRAERREPRGNSVPDPTAAAALDEPRLALREEVRKVERYLDFSIRYIRAMRGEPVPLRYVRTT